MSAPRSTSRDASFSSWTGRARQRAAGRRLAVSLSLLCASLGTSQLAHAETAGERAQKAADVARQDVAERTQAGAFAHEGSHAARGSQADHGHAHAYPGFLGVNWWAWEAHRPPMGWFILDFGIFVGLLCWAVKGPLGRVFAGRHEEVKRTIASAAQAHAKASHAHHDIRRKLAAMEAEIRALENATVQDGEAERDQMVAAAEAYAARLRAEGQRQADQEVRRSEEGLRRRLLAQVVGQAASKVQQRITADDHAHLLDEAIGRLASQGPKGRVGFGTARAAKDAGAAS